MQRLRTAAFAVLAIAYSRASAASVESAPASLLEWGPCPEYPEAGLSCTYFGIPLDYHNTSAGNGYILVVKSTATSGESKGTVFLNPGGPGVSGLDSLATDGPAIIEQTGGAYDIVSCVPRGVGPYTYPGSVYCLSDEEYDSFWNGSIEATGVRWLHDFTNQTDLDRFYDQVPLIEQQYRAFGERCLQGPNATTLQYVGTAATVRDMVALADAIQGPDTPIRYWGLSYGTIVGAWFMNSRVGAVILDGVEDATSVATKQSYLLWRTQVSSAEDSYNAFANACALAGPEECALVRSANATGADVVNYISKAIEVLKSSQSSKAPHRSPYTTHPAAIYGNLYKTHQWATLANETLPALLSLIFGSDSDGSSAVVKHGPLTRVTPHANNRPRRPAQRDAATYSAAHSYTEPAVVCADSVDADPALSMKDVFDEVVAVTRDVSHSFGAFFPVPWERCMYWPVRAVERYQGPFNTTLANRILVIGNSYDNATPFLEARRMAEVLGDQAALVRQNGFGHTSIYQASACTRKVIQDYLADGTLPSAKLTVCEIDDSVQIFPGVKSTSVGVKNSGFKA
ncbi:alpha/beta-hydrolase [Trametes elegans]|nr:alpha/beta-hydrolase [Trametes elegans]